MLDRNASCCAVLLWAMATPVFAQDSQPSTASEDVIQEPMPRSRAGASEPSESEPSPGVRKARKAPPKVAISVNPAMLLFGGFGAEVDTAVAPGVSLFVAPSVV